MIGFSYTIFKVHNVKRLESSKIDSMLGFKPSFIKQGNESKYRINLTMNTNGVFHIESTIKIKNTSADAWNELVFYFIPNMSTKKNAPQLEYPSTINFKKVEINEKNVSFKLDKDTLKLPLSSNIQPKKETVVHFSYDFTLPEKGLRLTKSGNNYFLAQFYPMLATYRNHKWNKEKYQLRGESYHTGFSDFKITYDIPKEFTITSTSQNDEYPSENRGSFEINNVKEVFISILKNPKFVLKKENNVSIRVFGMENDIELYKEISDVALDALNFFQQNIGPYPFKQLDIVLGEMGMEYPGIITAGSIYNSQQVSSEALKNMVVHEIAHQWFYAIISNDSFNDAWLDEGFANFAESLYYFSSTKEKVPYNLIKRPSKELVVNLPIDKYRNNQSSYIYGESMNMLWKLFEKRGGINKAKEFLKTYYQLYKFKELNTQEFVRFTKAYFNLKDNSDFEGWLKLN
ncbi:M1 family metallopeptidase [Heyndrickxia shackletonii]|nr:M1 family metallopeptidase [Heyndrickxia shackletonii]